MFTLVIYFMMYFKSSIIKACRTECEKNEVPLLNRSVCKSYSCMPVTKYLISASSNRSEDHINSNSRQEYH